MYVIFVFFFFFFNDTATTEIYTLSLHDALPISLGRRAARRRTRFRRTNQKKCRAGSRKRDEVGTVPLAEVRSVNPDAKPNRQRCKARPRAAELAEQAEDHHHQNARTPD